MPEEEQSTVTQPTRTLDTATADAPAAPRPALLAPGAWVAGRYRVGALLGRGGHGEVYRVADRRRDDLEVALKLHRRRALSRGALESLRAEFALLASLSHPNLAAVHDFAYVEGEYAFFTQTLIGGVPLSRTRLDPLEPRGVRLLAQLCRALDYLHARGIVHGDVKPGNVLVDVERERLTLLDFGVARALGGSTRDQIVGSPPYMAPELVTGGVADARTDLYAVGITLYQLVSGRVPFRGTSTEIMMAHCDRELPSLPGSVPIPLQALIARLTSKAPEDRPATASELLTDLSRIARVSVAVDTNETLASHVLSARFVGRERELRWLTERARDPAPERPPVLIEGEVGTGKSRLLREARARIQLRGQQWIQVQIARSERGPTLLAAIARAVLGPAERAALTDEERLELARALPELRRPRERLAVPLDPSRARRRRLEILGRQIAARFSWKSGVLAVEDLHWVSGAQQRELAQVVAQARAAGARCTVLLASRPGALDDATVDALEAVRLACDELDPEASRALVATTFGDPHVLDGTALGDRLAAAPSSALWVRESLRLALERGAIVRRDGRFVRVGAVPGAPLAEVLSARLRRLSRDARSVALAAAVLARAAGSSELAKVAGMKPARASPALAELVRRGVVERHDARERALYAMHDRYAEAVLAAMPARRIRAARRRAGRHLARRHRKDFRGLARAAHELAEAGDRGRAVRVLGRAADLAVQAGRPEAAVASLERELELRRPDDPDRAERALRLFDLAVLAGRPEAAGEALMEVAALAARTEEPRLSLEVTLRGIRQTLRDGDVNDARAECEAALARAAEAGLEELRCRLAIASGEIELTGGDWARSLERYRDGAERARRLERDDLRADAELGLALLHVRRGRDAASQAAAERAVAASKASRDPVQRAEALRMLGNAHFVGGRRARALRSYRRAVEVARRSGGAESEAKALNNVATCAHGLGQVREALAAWRRSIVLKERVGAIASAQLTWASMSGVLGVMGEREAARAAQERVIADERDDARTALSLAWSNRGDLELLEGRIDAAVEAYATAEAGYRRSGMHPLRTHALSGGVRTLLLRDGPGDRERARRWLSELEALTADDPAPEDRRRCLTARAMLRDAAADRSAAVAAAREAARILASDTAYEDVFGSSIDARWMLAVLLHRAGRRAEAARAAKRARELLARRARALDDAASRRRFRGLHPLHRAVAEGRLDQPPGRSWTP